MKKIWISIMIFTLLLSSISIALVVKSNAATITSENLFFEKNYEPLFKVESKISAVKGTSETWTTSLKSSFFVNGDPYRYIDLTKSLFKLKPNQLSFEKINLGVLDKRRMYNSSDVIETYTEKFTNLSPGLYKLVYTGNSTSTNGVRNLGHQEVFFTVDNDGVSKDWEKGIQNIVTINPTQSMNSASCNFTNNSTSKSSVVDQVSKEKVSTLDGFWMTKDRNNVSYPLDDARVEIWMQTCTNEWKLQVTSRTNTNGYYSVKYTAVQGAKQWKIRVVLDNEHVSMQDKNGIEYGAQYVSPDLSFGGFLGWLTIPANSFVTEASWAFMDVMRAVFMMTSANVPNEKLVIMYDTTSEYETGFIEKYNNIAIEQRYMYSPNVLYHELAHFYMYNLYGKKMPANTCVTDISSNSFKSTPECAFIEGWADFFSLYLNANSTYNALRNPMFTDTTSYQFDVDKSLAYDQHGDQSQARVARTLWDLYDSTNDGFDIVNYPFSQIYQVLKDDKVRNLKEFWSSWRNHGFDEGANKAFEQNHIIYKAGAIFTPNILHAVNGVSEKSFVVKGTGQYMYIEMLNRQKNSGFYVDVFTDINLTTPIYRQMTRSDKRSAVIENVQTIKGVTYFVSVRHTNANEMLDATIKLNLLSNPSFPVLIPTADSSLYRVMDGDPEKVYLIDGQDVCARFETRFYSKTTDTIIELYDDVTLKNRVDYDDNSAGSGYSKIGGFCMEPGKKYYLKVKNKIAGEFIYAKVFYYPIQNVMVNP